jgi:uncharacterized protein (DUF1800 family)
LDPEARSVSLDSDPSHGSLREPVLKVISFLRALGFENESPLIWPLLARLQDEIGECVYEAPTVFSFFLPQFIPSGSLGTAALVSPEAQVLSGPKITGILNGLFTTVKYGTSSTPLRRC